MRRRGCLLFLCLLTGCALVAPPLPPPTKSSREVGGVHHTVKRGENLWRIGRAYGVGVEQIAVLNGIDNPDRIEVGVRLFIPGARSVRLVRKNVSSSPPKQRPRWAAPPRRKAPTSSVRKTSRKPKSAARTHRVNNKRTPYRRAYGKRPRFSWPLRGRLIRRFKGSGSRKADGILIAARERDQVRAAAPGRVIYSDFGPGNLGRLIILRHHGGEYHSIYAHVARNLVRKGQNVSRGTPIALAGRTPRFRTARLHFEIRHRTRPRNPLSYLP
ncbi:MAG: M23 family metallopeptidase [Nitrospinae bacterium]|nr:M23 family metallopeptidase [Nitrospinota bacterium]